MSVSGPPPDESDGRLDAEPGAQRTVGRRQAEEFVVALLTAEHVPHRAAARTAAALILADVWGVSSHGLARLPLYLERLEAGGNRADAHLEPVKDTGPVVALDGGAGLGQWQLWDAADLSVERAQEHGVGVVTVGNSSHCGALGIYALPAVDAGLIGLLASNGPAAMPASGGSAPLFSTSPVAAGVPTAPDGSILDLALSAVTRGKVYERRLDGEQLEEGWALDRSGAPTVDPNEALSGMLQALGGTKGHVLAFLMEALTGAAVGPALSSDVVDVFDPSTADQPQGIAHVALALDPEVLSVDGDWRHRFEELARRIEATGGRLPGTDRIRRIRGGGFDIAVRPAIAATLVDWADHLDVDVPDRLR